MRLSQESDYALRALIYLAQQPPGTVKTAREIAKTLNIPEPFFFKIVRKLVRHGILGSQRARKRGYYLAQPPEEVTLFDIISSLEGPDILERCIFWNKRCGDDDPCLLHDYWRIYREPFVSKLRKISLKQMSDKKFNLFFQTF